MILTCPACGTSYVVKDGAIPPAGRQVRCASCKHSWHQDGEESLSPAPIEEAPAALVEDHGEPVEPPAYEPPPTLGTDALDEDTRRDMDGAVEPEPTIAVPFDTPERVEPAEAESLSTIDVSSDPLVAPKATEAADDGYDWDHGSGAATAPRRGRGWIVILALIVLVAGLAAAAWFLAPPEWLARAGITQDSAGSPLKLMVTSQDRQKLASGNDLVSLSGRVINPTDATQSVPPLQADLRNGAGKLVYSWTIAPPAASLPPRASASFNAAELGVPADATSLTLRWAG